jgi:ubiquinone/menaquinone biosynthesis C-methylase UbiE
MKYRPHYPLAAIDYICSELELDAGSIVADLGSGTGISAKPLLERGITVYAIEPNDEMRHAQAEYLDVFETIRGIKGTSESTTLLDASVDHAIAAQAFHWFDPIATRHELKRILRPNGKLGLLWNERLTETTPFLRDYEALLHAFSTDYESVDHRNITEERLATFFENGFTSLSFKNVQHVDLDALTGRLKSCSYVPAKGEPRFAEMIEALTKLFVSYQSNGEVSLDYDCKVFVGIVVGAIK